MATAKNDSPAPTSKLRVAGYILILFLVILGAVFAWNYNFIKGQLAVGTAYGARVACSCHYIGGRDIGDCRKDFEPGMELIGLSVDDDNRQVTASVPLLSSATAEFREGWGCIMTDTVKLDVD
ncbi:hypothetical protein SAMN02745824_0400 [Parasphingorhabdus marina DSM 22363]|uniref:Uncharacterized protein n=1 Tax=Parasphingorhabdus marina DSM 22363 TaxID=1123272 RepID=A0A1N6CMS9_9SPHN|nr:hypothetical protein [Parasphingorhabdus marina]SIN59863.1 hypothetical protein SAMN02745824_0400 [Parasphingorhabdus marina DSM 22363]